MFKFLKRKKPQYLYDETSPAGKSQPAGMSVGSSPQQLTNFTLPKNLAQDLLKLLLRKRSELSTSLDVMPYMIASNLALTQLATKRPLNLDEIRALKIDGFSEVKIVKFGPTFLQCIQQKMNYLPPTSSQAAGDDGSAETLESLLEKNPFGGAKVGARKEVAYSRFKSGLTVPMIANEMQVQPSTVTSYLVDLMKCGFKFTRADLRQLDVNDVLFENIRVVLPDLQAENCVRLTELKQLLPEHVTFDQVKLVATWFQIRQHARELDIPYRDEEASTEGRSDGHPLGAAVKSEGSDYFTPTETAVPPKAEVPVKTDHENLWDDESDSMDFDMDRVMNDLEANAQAQISTERSAAASQNCAETPTATSTQPKLPAGSVSKPQLSKLKATKRVIYEQTSSDEEMTEPAKSDDPPVKRALPNWMGKGIASGDSAETKPPSKFQFKQKKTTF
jgi:Helix-turn-helix domain/HRDC domain